MGHVIGAALLLLSVAACDERAGAPHADLRDEGGTPVIQMSPGAQDASVDAMSSDAELRDAGTDDGQVDGGSTTFCREVAADDTTNRFTGNEVGSDLPIDFTAHYAFAEWDRTCNPTTLFMGLAEASCVPNVGDQLTFALARESIGTALMAGGNQIEIAPFEDRVSVTFRDTDAGRPAYLWGNCIDSSGSLLIEDIGPDPGDRITLTYDLVLSDCAEPQQLAPIAIRGAIDITVPNFEPVCP